MELFARAILALLIVAVILPCEFALTPIKSNVKVGSLVFSPIGCGTWAWGNRFLWNYSKDDDEGLRKTYDFVTSKGVNWFDTADSYGTGALNGRSEELLGQFSTENKRSKVYFCTKLAPYPWRIGTESMLSAAKESTERMNRPIDMVQLHWPPSLGWQETEYLTAFNKLVQSKGATQIGVSNYGPKSLRRVSEIVKKGGGKIVSNQVYITTDNYSIPIRISYNNFQWDRQRLYNSNWIRTLMTSLYIFSFSFLSFYLFIFHRS